MCSINFFLFPSHEHSDANFLSGAAKKPPAYSIIERFVEIIFARLFPSLSFVLIAYTHRSCLLQSFPNLHPPLFPAPLTWVYLSHCLIVLWIPTLGKVKVDSLLLLLLLRTAAAGRALCSARARERKSHALNGDGPVRGERERENKENYSDCQFGLY